MKRAVALAFLLSISANADVTIVDTNFKQIPPPYYDVEDNERDITSYASEIYVAKFVRTVHRTDLKIKPVYKITLGSRPVEEAKLIRFGIYAGVVNASDVQEDYYIMGEDLKGKTEAEFVFTPTEELRKVAVFGDFRLGSGESEGTVVRLWYKDNRTFDDFYVPDIFSAYLGSHPTIKFDHKTGFEDKTAGYHSAVYWGRPWSRR